MANVPFTSGEVVVATGNYTAGSTPAKSLIFANPYRTTDGTPVNNSTVLVADDVLKFDIGASEVWAFECGIYWTSATASLKFDFTGPASPTAVIFGYDSADSNIAGTPEIVTAFETTLPNYHRATSAFFAVKGVIQNGVNAGTVQLRIAQVAQVAEDTKLLKGSYLIPRRLA